MGDLIPSIGLSTAVTPLQHTLTDAAVSSIEVKDQFTRSIRVPAQAQPHINAPFEAIIPNAPKATSTLF